MSEAEQILALPLLPIKNSVLFPSVLMPLTVGRPLSMAAIEAVLDKIEVQGLHQDALVLGKLTDELQGATNELNELKATLEQIAAVAEFGAALLNTVASLLPLL